MQKIEDVIEVKNEVVEKGKEKTESRLEKLGFKNASSKVKELKDMQRKLMIAHEHYRFVRQERIDEFNGELKKKTIKGEEPFNAKWQTLDFCPIASYEKAPPTEVLDKLEEAQDLKCFDAFEVAYIREVNDPILFGRINNCSDRFFIAQWDNDVSIDDLISEGEGWSR